MEADNPAERFLNAEFPPTLYRLIPAALRRAYLAADAIMEQHPQFSTPGGRFQRGDLIAMCADYEFWLLVTSRNLPFVVSADWEDYAKPTGKFFVMRSLRAHITISQVSDPKRKPRFACFRHEYALPNGPYLFGYMNDEFEHDQERRLIHIVHGYQGLAFAHLTLPHPHNRGNMWISRNLMKIPHEVPNPLPQPEGPLESPNPETIEIIERQLRDDE
jgi:hypothetical protein